MRTSTQVALSAAFRSRAVDCTFRNISRAKRKSFPADRAVVAGFRLFREMRASTHFAAKPAASALCVWR